MACIFQGKRDVELRCCTTLEKKAGAAKGEIVAPVGSRMFVMMIQAQATLGWIFGRRRNVTDGIAGRRRSDWRKRSAGMRM